MRSGDPFEEARRRKRLDRLRAMPITELDVRAIFHEALIETKALKAMRALEVDPEARFVLFAGPRGIGKTVACAWLLRDGGRFTTADDLRRAFTTDTDWAREERELLINAQRLVVDDIGIERDADAARLALQAVIANRQNGYRKTAITTNLSIKALSERFDIRTIDRIRHQGHIIELQDENKRTPPNADAYRAHIEATIAERKAAEVAEAETRAKEADESKRIRDEERAADAAARVAFHTKLMALPHDKRQAVIDKSKALLGFFGAPVWPEDAEDAH